MDTLKDFLERAYSIRQTPTYIANRCTDRKTIGPSCSVCVDICPQNIYPSGKRKRPIWDQCLKCGLCSASCPAKCITVPSRRAESFMIAAARKGRLTVACGREESGARLEVRCVASLSWEQLAFAALRDGVTVSLRKCPDCSNEFCKRTIENNLGKVRFFLGDETYGKTVKVLREGDPDDPDDNAEEPVSRRDFFNIFNDLSVDRAFAMMPKIDDIRDNGLIFRALLRDAVSEKAKDLPAADRPRYSVMMPRFTEKCYNCGYCATACPNGALKFVPGDESFTVTVDVWKCTSCGLCKNQCRADGISGIVAMRVSTLDTVAVARIKNHLCPVCGKPYPYSEEQEYGRCRMCEAKIRNEEHRNVRKQNKEKEESG